MRIVQDYLKECDRETIINSYICKYGFSPSTMLMRTDPNITIGKLIENYRYNLNKMIDILVSIQPEVTDERWILLTVHQAEEDDLLDIRHCLFKESELDTPGYIVPYGYSFTPFETAVGYYVADTYLTQHEIEDLLTDFLFEVSWTGYAQEYLEDHITALEAACKASEEEEGRPLKDLIKDLDLILEKKDPAQEEAWHVLMKQKMEYNEICQRIEINKLKESLC